MNLVPVDLSADRKKTVTCDYSITVNIVSGTYGHIISVLRISVFNQRFVINRTIRFCEQEESTIRKSILYKYARYNDKLSTGVMNKYLRFFEPVSEQKERRNMNRAIIETTNIDNCNLNIQITYKTSKYPVKGYFYILLYNDPYYVQLSEVSIIL